MAAVDLDSFRFGDSADLADSLLSLVMIGRKTATCWAARDGQQTFVGKQMIVRDGMDHPRIVIETISLCQQRFSDVDADFAAAEGEGDGSLAAWRAGHKAYFERNGGFSHDMMLWCERFRVVRTL